MENRTENEEDSKRTNIAQTYKRQVVVESDDRAHPEGKQHVKDECQ